jgi:hypothetical protein
MDSGNEISTGVLEMGQIDAVKDNLMAIAATRPSVAMTRPPKRAADPAATERKPKRSRLQHLVTRLPILVGRDGRTLGPMVPASHDRGALARRLGRT